MITEEAIQARIAQLKDEREKFILQANQTIAAYDAAIGELTRLIEAPTPTAPGDESGAG